MNSKFLLLLSLIYVTFATLMTFIIQNDIIHFILLIIIPAILSPYIHKRIKQDNDSEKKKYLLGIFIIGGAWIIFLFATFISLINIWK